MQAMHQELYDRLMAFEIDEPGTELTFARRLARENGWSLEYSERVIAEYKRFVFLAMTAGHVVTPSEDVDQAWHLHLTYTRSYWDRLCREVLGQPLHHGPTKGGAAEQAKFVALYNQTLESYQRLTGQPPPEDIWPPPAQRFGEDLHHVRVNTDRYWLVPKPSLSRCAAWLSGWAAWPQCDAGPPRLPLSGSLLVTGVVALPLAGLGFNPLDWQGREFLTLYAAWAVTALFVSVLLRLWTRADGTSTYDAPPQAGKQSPLDPYELACLAAGPIRAVHAAVAAMVQAKTLQIVEEPSSVLGGILTYNTRTIRQGVALSASAPRLERVLYDAALIPASDLKPLMQAGLPVARDIEHDLRKRGLLAPIVPPLNCLAAAAVMATPLLIGLPKIAVGLSRERPVGFLIAACVVTISAAVAFLAVRSRLTAAGKAILSAEQQQHFALNSASEQDVAAMPPHDLALAVGLYGAAMLVNTPLESVHDLLPRSSGGGCSSGGCSAGGCGGGGCGGGGCGGGCGGCGGG